MTERQRKGDHQKLKLLYLARIFLQETDDRHFLTMAQIIEKLSAYGVNADRKTLYLDFEELRNFGMDLITVKEGRNCFYHLGRRDFELPELKLLVDSVQSAKFITDKKSKELIKKLESLTSKYEGKQLHRQVVITGRIKTMNESIYYNVDVLHEAIDANAQIRFQYYQWNIRKEMELRRNGAWYQISPWQLMWDDENYYLIGYDAQSSTVKHYRIDKMLHITITQEPREGSKAFAAFNLPRYTNSLFGMYTGTETRVTLEAENTMAGILIDRFGKDILIIPTDQTHFSTVVSVAVSRQFLGWIIALGDRIRIVSPDTVVGQMKAEIRRLAEQYQI